MILRILDYKHFVTNKNGVTSIVSRQKEREREMYRQRGKYRQKERSTKIYKERKMIKNEI